MPDNNKVTYLAPRYIREAKDMLKDMDPDKAQSLLAFIANLFLDEIRLAVDGEIEGPDEAPFFTLVEKIYKEAEPTGCYFCDRSIDGNEVPFDPKTTRVCLTCSIKVGNLLRAFGSASEASFMEENTGKEHSHETPDSTPGKR